MKKKGFIRKLVESLKNPDKNQVKDTGIAFVGTGILSGVSYQISPALGIFIAFLGFSVTLGVLSAYAIGLSPRRLYRMYKTFYELQQREHGNLNPFDMIDSVMNPASAMEQVQEFEEDDN